MCKAVDVASYILQEKGRLTGYQLQKLLYYSQAWCLVTQDRPLFSEKIRAWDHGPVVYEVYCEHARQRSVVQSDLSGRPDALTSEDMAVVDAVLDSYSGMSGDAIEDLSHHEDPWRDAYNGTSSAHSPIISNEAMSSYYSMLMSSDRWTTETHHVPHFSYAPRLFVSDAEYDWLAGLIQEGHMLCRVARLEELDEGVLDGFTCGDDWMDDWLANKANRQLKSGLCAMHVGLDEDDVPVGFFTLATCQIMPTDVLKRERHGYNRMPFGALLIGELAVRSDLRGGMGYGTKLLNHAIFVACNISHDAGVSFIVVDPLGGNEHICRWYQHNGFVSSPQGSRHYMSIRRAKERVADLGEDYFLFD